MWPAAWPASASAMYCAVFSGAGTAVYHSSHSRPSAAAAASASRCSGVSGSRRRPPPSSVTGSGRIMRARSALDRLPLLAPVAAGLDLADVLGDVGHLAGRVAHVHLDPAQPLAQRERLGGERLHVAAHRDDEGV